MPPRSSAALLAVLAGMALVTAGCGRSDEDRVRDTLARFERDAAQGDFKDLCRSVLATPLVKGLQDRGLPCELALERGLGSVVQPSITVEKVRVRGKVALALVTTTAAGQRPSRDTIRLVKQGDTWRISSLSGAQPPAPKRDLTGKEAQ